MSQWRLCRDPASLGLREWTTLCSEGRAFEGEAYRYMYTFTKLLAPSDRRVMVHMLQSGSDWRAIVTKEPYTSVAEAQQVATAFLARAFADVDVAVEYDIG